MRERCPDARVKCTARLSGYKLTFPRHSKNRNGGVASIQKCDDSEVWGIVFILSEADEKNLDRHEGVPFSYKKEIIEVVEMPGDLNLNVFTYIGNPQAGVFNPSEFYLSLIIEGLKARKEVPQEYIRFVENVSTST